METERELVEELKQKSEYAFEMIYEKYHKLVYHVIYFIVKNHETTEELVQDTFIKMYNNIQTLRNINHFKNWLLRIAKNIAYDEVKKHRLKLVDDEEIIDELITNEYIIKDMKLDFSAALNDFEYSVLVLVLVYELKRRDVSYLLEKPLTSIQRAYQEGLKKLKSYYGGKGEN